LRQDNSLDSSEADILAGALGIASAAGSIACKLGNREAQGGVAIKEDTPFNHAILLLLPKLSVVCLPVFMSVLVVFF
jgi:hypothetical protein